MSQSWLDKALAPPRYMYTTYNMPQIPCLISRESKYNKMIIKQFLTALNTLHMNVILMGHKPVRSKEM